MLQQALALSLSQQDDKSSGGVPKMPDLSAMTEEEQLNYALQMSMAASHAATSGSQAAATETSSAASAPGSAATTTTSGGAAADKPSTASVDDTEMKDVNERVIELNF